MTKPDSRSITQVKLAWVAIALVLIISIPNFGAASGPPEPTRVSMISLIAAPAKYDGRIVQTVGYLNVGSVPEDDSLWLHEEDGRLFITKNSIELRLSPAQRAKFKSASQTYVLVIGTFRSADDSDLSSGTISDITRLVGWAPHSDARVK